MSTKYQRIGDYVLKSQLGAGQYGTVYLSEDTRTREQRAIKVLKYSSNYQIGDEKKPRALMYLEAEIKAMRILDNEHIVKLFDAFYTKLRFYLVMEYCNGGDLQRKIESGLSQVDTFRLFQQLAQALKEMHTRKIMHRDLKPANILLHNGLLKLGDFGLAKEYSALTRPNSYVGTRKYMAPEVLAIRVMNSGNSYTEQADLWSAGVILYEMLTAEKLFTSKDETSLRVEQEQKTRSKSYLKGMNNVSEMCKDLLTKVLVFDPLYRISLEDFYNHPFVTGSTLLSPSLDFSGLMCLEETKPISLIPVLALDIAEELCQYALEATHPFIFYLKACQVLAQHVHQDPNVKEAFQSTFAKMETAKCASDWEHAHASVTLMTKALELYKEADRYGPLVNERRMCYQRILHLVNLVGRCQVVELFRNAVMAEMGKINNRHNSIQ